MVWSSRKNGRECFVMDSINYDAHAVDDILDLAKCSVKKHII